MSIEIIKVIEKSQRWEIKDGNKNYLFAYDTQSGKIRVYEGSEEEKISLDEILMQKVEDKLLERIG